MGEIDLEQASKPIPAGRMKAECQYRVPLGAALAPLHRDHATCESPVGFGEFACRQIGSQANVQRMELQVTVHGVRSVFGDWRTNFPRDINEMTLADTIKKRQEGVPAERPARQAA